MEPVITNPVNILQRSGELFHTNLTGEAIKEI